MIQRLLVAGALLFAAVGCGRGSGAAQVVPPPPVPVSIVPQLLNQGKFAVLENTDKKTTQAFAGGGKKVLIGDGKLWEIRDGQRLLGTLQVATLKSKVDVTKGDTRESIVRGLMPGQVNRLDVDNITVYSTSSNDKIVYLWFGKRMFQVIQLKGNALEPEVLLNELIAYQLSTVEGARLLLRTADDEEEAAAG